MHYMWINKNLLHQVGDKPRLYYDARSTNHQDLSVFEYFILFAPCIVIPLCKINNEMHKLKINALIRLLTSSTCFEPHGFIIRKTVCTRSVCTGCFSCIYVSSLAGGLLKSVHETIPYKKCVYHLSSWWWTHEVRNK